MSDLKIFKTKEELPDPEGLKGLPVGAVMQIYGPYESGKTTLALQLCCSASIEAIVWIDTEGCQFQIAEWLAKFSKRYSNNYKFIDMSKFLVGLDTSVTTSDGVVELDGYVKVSANEIRGYVVLPEKKVKPGVGTLLCPVRFQMPVDAAPSIQRAKPALYYIGLGPKRLWELLGLFGASAMLLTDKKKAELYIKQHFIPSPLEAFVTWLAQTHNSIAIVLDSIMMPIKRYMGSATYNLPARSIIYNVIGPELVNICIKHADKCTAIIINHASQDPHNPYSTPQPSLSGLKYVTKFSYGIQKLSGGHRITRDRHPYLPPKKGIVMLQLGDEGFLKIEGGKVAR